MFKYSIIFLSIALLCLLFHTYAQEETEDEPQQQQLPKLLVHKTAQSDAVVHTNMTFSITIYNVGSSSAHEVNLNDGHWPDEDFESLSGETFAKWDSIAPGESVTYEYTIKGRKEGIWNAVPATVTYKESEEDSELLTVRSTDIPSIRIMSQQQYDKLNADQWDQWLIFVVLSTLPIATPALLHFYARKQIYSLANDDLSTFEKKTE